MLSLDTDLYGIQSFHHRAGYTVVNSIFWCTFFCDLLYTPYKYFIKSFFITNDFTIEIIISTIYFTKITYKLYLAKPPKLQSIMKLLFQEFLFLDVIAIVPLYYYDMNFLYLRLFIFYRYPMFINKIRELINTFFFLITHSYLTSKNISEVLSFVVNLFFIFHFLGCLYIYIGTNSLPSWLDQIRHYSSWEQYLVVLYILMQTFTTTGIGDFPPSNSLEHLLLIFFLIIGCGLFAYFISRIISIITYTDKNTSIKGDKSILYIRNLSFDVFYEAKSHLRSFLGVRNNLFWLTKFPFLKQLKPRLREEIITNTFSSLFQKFDAFFSCFSYSTKERILLNLKTKAKGSNEVPLSQGEKIRKVFFILNGKIEVFKNNKLFGVLEGGYFGDFYIMGANSEFTFKIQEEEEYDAEKVYTFYTITVEKLNEILSYDEEGFSNFYQSALNRRASIQYTGGELQELKKLSKAEALGKIASEKEALGENNLGFMETLNDDKLKQEIVLDELIELEKRLDIAKDQLKIINKEFNTNRKKN